MGEDVLELAWQRAMELQTRVVDRRWVEGLDEALQAWAVALRLEFPGGDGITCEPDTFGLRRTRPGEQHWEPWEGMRMPYDILVSVPGGDAAGLGRVEQGLRVAIDRMWGVDEFGEERSVEEAEEAMDMGERTEFPFTKYVSVPTLTDGALLVWFDFDQVWCPLAFRTVLRIVREELLRAGGTPAHLARS